MSRKEREKVEKQFKGLTRERRPFEELRQAAKTTFTAETAFYIEKLQEAIDDEERADRMYHYLQSTARHAGFSDHEASFILIATDERKHKDWLTELLNQVKQRKVEGK